MIRALVGFPCNMSLRGPAEAGTKQSNNVIRLLFAYASPMMYSVLLMIKLSSVFGEKNAKCKITFKRKS